jgi:molybdopterin synthase catalytic subunit
LNARIIPVVPLGDERSVRISWPVFGGIVAHGRECMNGESVAGGDRILIALSSEPIDGASLLSFVADPASGCSVLFTGTVRDHSEGRPGVSRLEYEAYAGVVEGKMAAIATEALDRWEVLKVAVVHRVGVLGVGEPAVVVAVSAGHRRHAFPAARYVIDELKARAPIWKKEHWEDGAEWVEGP